MKWKKVSEELPQVGKLVSFWSSHKRRFFCGTHEIGHISAWRSCSGNLLKMTPGDCWILLPDLIISETLSETCVIVKN